MASRTVRAFRLQPPGSTKAHANDSATGCRPPQSPRPPKALHTTRTPWLFPASSPHLSPSSNPLTQSPQSHSTPPSASPGSLFSSQSTPHPALPTSPCPVSRLAPPPPTSITPLFRFQPFPRLSL